MYGADLKCQTNGQSSTMITHSEEEHEAHWHHFAFTHTCACAKRKGGRQKSREFFGGTRKATAVNRRAYRVLSAKFRVQANGLMQRRSFIFHSIFAISISRTGSAIHSVGRWETTLVRTDLCRVFSIFAWDELHRETRFSSAFWLNRSRSIPSAESRRRDTFEWN